MRISRRSASSAAMAGLLVLTGASPAPEGSRLTIGDKGSEAMERLRDAVGKTREHPAASVPTLPDLTLQPARRRAFEGLARRLPDPAMEARARAAQVKGAASLAAERDRQAKALRAALGLEPGEDQALAKAAPGPGAKAWVPVLLVSSSMPVPVLRAYAQQLEKVRGVMALRGMPGGMRKVGPLARLTAEILRIDPGCEGPGCAMRDVQFIVDPMLFRSHGIARVPALLMLTGDPTQPYCEREDGDTGGAGAPIVYGDSALAGLFDEYARLGGKEEVAHAQALLGAR